MTLHAISVDVTLTEINCGECGGTYALNERYRQQQYQNGGSWSCPYCRCWWGYANNSENSRLKKQLEAEKNGRELAERRAARANEQKRTAVRKASAQKGVATRAKNRAKAGLCPCCNRTFKQLVEHMKSKHPEITLEKTKNEC